MPTSDEVKQVFISSTYKDLRKYRKAVIQAVSRFQWFAVVMEDFVAQDNRPKDLCLNKVSKRKPHLRIFAGASIWFHPGGRGEVYH